MPPGCFMSELFLALPLCDVLQPRVVRTPTVVPLFGARSLIRSWAGVAVEALPRELPRGSQLRAACAALRPAGGGEVPEQAMDLLERLMDPDPFTRISAAEALSHPFITGKQPDCGA